MKWMSNLRIRSKLLLGFGVVLVLMLFLVVLASTRLVAIDSDYSYVLDRFIVPRADAIKEADLRISKLRRTVSVIGVYVGEDDKIAAAEPQIHSAYNDINEPFDRYLQILSEDTRISEDDKKMRIDNIKEIREILSEYYNTIAMGIINETKNNDVDAVSALITEAIPLVSAVDQKTTELVVAADKMKDDLSKSCSDSARQALVLLISVAVVALIIGMIMMLLITSAITKPVKALTDLLAKVSEGDLNVNAASNARDEIGDLTRDVGKVVDVIKSLVTDINNVAKDFDKGDIEAEINEHKYHGSYKDVAKGFNNSLKTIVNEALTFIKCMVAFSEGDFEANIPQLPGKKVIMNTSRDQLRENLMGVNNDIAHLVNQATAGELKARINADKYKGDWNSLVESLNGLMEAIATPISDTLESLVEVSKGNLSSRVTGTYRGEFAEMKTALNNTMSTLSSYIDEISKTLGAMSNQDLTCYITRDYIGDFTEMKESINKIVGVFNNLLTDINSSADQVASGATQISESSMSLAQGTTEQASSIEELNATVEDISNQTKVDSENAKYASELALKAKEAAETGSEEMTIMLKSMEGINESSNNISKIIKVIDDIAFQTNLLALNAAVEAARAGEHGKGFAVVAEEVRSLAGRSQNAARETSALIEGSVEKVAEGSNIANKTASSFKTIVSEIVEIATMLEKTAKASQRQAEALGQMNIGVSQIAAVTQANSASSEEQASAAQELSSQADLFKGMVSKFKL